MSLQRNVSTHQCDPPPVQSAGSAAIAVPQHHQQQHRQCLRCKNRPTPLNSRLKPPRTTLPILPSHNACVGPLTAYPHAQRRTGLMCTALVLHTPRYAVQSVGACVPAESRAVAAAHSNLSFSRCLSRSSPPPPPVCCVSVCVSYTYVHASSSRPGEELPDSRVCRAQPSHRCVCHHSSRAHTCCCAPQC